MEAFKNFLAFFGLSSIKLEDGVGNIEVQTKQLDKANLAFENLVKEREDAKKEFQKVSAELAEERQQMVAKDEELNKANITIDEQATEIETLKADNTRLKALDGAQSANPKKKTDGNHDAKGPVTSDANTHDENFEAVRKKYFPNS